VSRPSSPGGEDHADLVRRRLRAAEILAVGGELTSGDSHDTNGDQLAGSRAGAGVTTRRSVALPDDVGLVSDAAPHATTPTHLRREDAR
jgi:hypothetical protein